MKPILTQKSTIKQEGQKKTKYPRNMIDLNG